ncbi:hypothetical protein ABMA59_13350 [Mesorhizobium sp. CN2-181]
MPISVSKSAAAVVVVIAALFCGAAQAQFTTLQQRQQNELLHKRLGIPLPVIERWQKTQDFQQQQQRNRAQDRRQVMRPQRKAPIPRIRPTCLNPIYGNEYMRRNKCP